MKRSRAVTHILRQSSHAFIGCVLSSLLSLYVTTLWLNGKSDTIRAGAPTEPSVQGVVQTAPPKEVDHVRLVSEIIEQDIPAHPDKHSLATLIVSESKRAEIDPLFVTAVVRTESHFKNKAVSRRGAKGLMQLMPETGRYIAKLSRIELKNIDALHNPETNIRLGVWYLKHLHERFEGDRKQALVAYNWGPTNLRRAMASGSQFPKESVQYVHRVISHYTASTEKLRQYALASRTDMSLG
jgi:hypothetical protein